MTEHLSLAAMEAGLADVRQAPQDEGTVEMIVARPGVDERQVLQTAVFNPEHGLDGDNWQQRGSSRTDDGSAHSGRQLTLMNSRAAQLFAQRRERWPLAGDQVYVDLDVSEANLPPGQQLQMGTAVIEITDQAHTGCLKFAQRFGNDALKFVNQPEGRALRLRGVYARVITAGTVQAGDSIRKNE